MSDDVETVSGISKAWLDHADATIAKRNEQQAFVNEMLDCLNKIAFVSVPHRGDLLEVVHLAVRLAHTCYKQGGFGSVRGYGIQRHFLDAVRKYAIADTGVPRGDTVAEMVVGALANAYPKSMRSAYIQDEIQRRLKIEIERGVILEMLREARKRGVVRNARADWYYACII